MTGNSTRKQPFLRAPTVVSTPLPQSTGYVRRGVLLQSEMIQAMIDVVMREAPPLPPATAP